MTIDQADVDATLADGTLTLRKGVATGIGVKADACGTIAFGETGTSALDVTMDADDLTAIGTWSGQPIAGAGHIEAHVTGPHDQPALTGRYSLRQIAYGGDVSALTLNGDLHASMPEWRVADATFSSTSEGAFVKVKSVEITRLSGQASYREQPDRSRRGSGRRGARAEDCRPARVVRAQPRALGPHAVAHDRRRDVDAAGGNDGGASRRRHED